MNYLPVYHKRSPEVLLNMADDERTSLIVVIIDTNPVWWGMKADVSRILTGSGQLAAKSLATEFHLVHCLEAMMAFCNAHLMMNQKNQLAVIAAHNNTSKFVYPRQEPREDKADSSEDEAVPRGRPGDGKYDLFTQLDGAIADEICNLVLNDPDTELHSDTLMAGAMATALCYINRQMRLSRAAGTNLTSRVVMIKCAEAHPAQYMHFMNVVFTAQKQNVTIDACVLDSDSSLLQQACDLTGGIYLRIPQISGLLQYLLWVFLPDTAFRRQLHLPTKAQVDYRAACFCHRTLIDVGYVCSVCFSIFCTFSPLCSTCQTKFRFLAPLKSKMPKKKMKKSNP